MTSETYQDLTPEFVSETTAYMQRMVRVIGDLIASHGDLLDVVDTMSAELAALSALVDADASIRAATLSDAGALGAEARQAHRHAETLTDRAAAILARSHALQDDSRSLQRLDGHAPGSPRSLSGFDGVPD